MFATAASVPLRVVVVVVVVVQSPNRQLPRGSAVHVQGGCEVHDLDPLVLHTVEVRE